MIARSPVRALLRGLVVLLGILVGGPFSAWAQVAPTSSPAIPASDLAPLPEDMITTPDTLASLRAKPPSPPPARAKGLSRFPVWFTPSSARSIHGVSVGPVLSWPDANRWKKINGVGISFIGFGAAPTLFYGPLTALLPTKQLGLLSDRDHDGTMEVWGGDIDTLNAQKQSGVDAFGGNDQFGTVVNGLLLSPGGALARSVRGVAVSGLIGGLKRSTGLAVNALWSTSGRHRGVIAGTYTNLGTGHGLAAGGSVLSVEMTGAQIAALNQAARLRGVQVGLYNFSGDLQGVQIGLLNRTPERTLPFLNWNFN